MQTKLFALEEKIVDLIRVWTDLPLTHLTTLVNDILNKFRSVPFDEDDSDLISIKLLSIATSLTAPT